MAEGNASAEMPSINLNWYRVDTDATETASAAGFSLLTSGARDETRQALEGMLAGRTTVVLMAVLAILLLL